jgi:hypothetical protein
MRRDKEVISLKWLSGWARGGWTFEVISTGALERIANLDILEANALFVQDVLSLSTKVAKVFCPPPRKRTRK